MEFGWIRSRCWLGKGVGCLERVRAVPGVELWVGEPDRREQVREIILGRDSNTELSQVQGRVHEWHPGSCGLLDLCRALLSQKFNSFGLLVTLSFSSSLTPMNAVSN